jgi:2-oxoglutarate dehydrogenase E2 component (dihydrolipoamide succinyltransferase)
MSIELVVPALGESVSEATVARWIKHAGDSIAIDEPLVELETDKVTVEVPAPAAGVLSEILADEGANVGVGSVLARIDEGAAAAKPAAEKEPAAAAASAPAARAEQAAPAAAPSAKPVPPAARKLVEEHGLDPARIPASGKDGRLTKGDVLAFVEQGGASRAPAAPVPAEARPADARQKRVRMSRLRRRIAERLKEAQNTAAMLTTFNEADMTEVLAIRRQFREEFEKSHGVRLGFMSFFVKACIAALHEVPSVNAEIDGDEIVYKNHYDIGVAVGTAQGLVVPVVRDADAMSFADIEKKIAEFGRRARDGKLTLDELTGGTFTISNGGVYGSLLSTPILNPPQSGILGMHKIQERPMVMPDGTIQARPMMYLALSYDHRIIDGSEAVSCLVRIKEHIEDPRRLLFGV